MITEDEAEKLAKLACERIGINSVGRGSVPQVGTENKNVPSTIIQGASLQTMPRQVLNFNKLANWENAIANVTANISSQALAYLPANGVFVDVGANTGLFTSQVVLSRPEAKGYLFEPVPEYAQCCEERFRGYNNLNIENLALSDSEGSLTLWMGKDNLGWNTLVAPKTDSSMTPIQIKAVTFDDYADAVGINEIDVIKIDVEGAEYLVLEGMKRTLARLNKKPVILCEIGWGCNSHPEWEREKAIFEWLFENGYERCDYNVTSTSDVVFIPRKGLSIEISSGSAKSFEVDLKKKCSNPRITIGIPTRDRLDQLLNLLKSIQGQSYQNFELIVSDDGTIFDLEYEIKRAIPDLNFTYTRGPGISLPSNRQHIIEMAKTELVIMCDDDHFMDFMCVEELVKAITQDDGIGIVSAIWPTANEEMLVVDYEQVKDKFEFCGSLSGINENSDFWWKNGCDLFKASQKDPTPKEYEIAGGGCLIYRKRIIQEVGGFPLDYSRVSFREDSDMSHRVYLAGYKVLLNTRAVAIHFFAPAGGCRDGDNWAINFVSDGTKFLKKLSWWRTRKSQIESLRQAGPIKVLMFYDEEGWAWWHRAHNLKKNLPELEITILRVGDRFDQNDFDFIFLFDAYLLGSIGPVERNKLIVSNSCPKLLGDTVSALNSDVALASVVNNWDTYKRVSHDNRYFCCQNGVDTDLFYPSKIEPERFTACWVGNSLSIGQKGLDLIQEACRQADVPLIICDVSKLSKVSDAISQAQVRDEIYHKSSVFICASLFEGTPNPALEALASGLPVISTSVGNMPELIVDGVNGYLVKRSVEDIVNALLKLKTGNQKELRHNARDSVEIGWSWKYRSSLYLSMFEELRRRVRYGDAPSFDTPEREIIKIAEERSLVDLPRPLFSAFVEEEEGNFITLKKLLIDWCSNAQMIHTTYALLSGLPDMYLHFGGIGDAVLLLSTFYDRNPEQVILSVSNNVQSSKAFFKQFPKLKKVYFVELNDNDMSIYAFMLMQAYLPNCLGRGATPSTTHAEEWVVGVDIFSTYGINANPKWPFDFSPTYKTPNQVVLAPCGSMKSMADGKRNIIDSALWIPLQKSLLDMGYSPVVIGLPKESEMYPAIPGVVDARGFDLGEHMGLMRGAQAFIGADSWAKSFAALLNIPTLVFAPMYKGSHDRNYYDPSSNIFLKPWRNIKVVYEVSEVVSFLNNITSKQYISDRV